jgi:hypothetical protein
MPIVTLLLLVLLGILGISSWVKSRQPNAGMQLAKLEQFEGWIGLVGLVWGIVMLLQWLQMLEYIRYAGGAVIVGLVMVLVIIALSLILAMPVLRSLFGANNFTNKLADFSGKLMPYKVGLGFSCLVLAVYLLVTLSSVRAL